jgi:hypothetical protein
MGYVGCSHEGMGVSGQTTMDEGAAFYMGS